MNSHIGILIPSTTHKREWTKFKETTLCNIFFQSFFTTYCKKYKYTIYLVVDDDDHILSNMVVRKQITKYISIMQNTSIEFISSSGIPKGWVTHMWNRAFKRAYDDGCDYFFQSGDDIRFMGNNWVSDSILMLEQHNGIGLTGPMDYGRIKNNNSRSLPGGDRFIQTQSFVSRKHMEIFGFYFPEEIKNWFCDDWITKVYYPKNFYKINHYILNMGGNPRYDIIGQIHNPNDPTFKACNRLIHECKIILDKFTPLKISCERTP
jgi:hypothetical protein